MAWKANTSTKTTTPPVDKFCTNDDGEQHTIGKSSNSSNETVISAKISSPQAASCISLPVSLSASPSSTGLSTTSSPQTSAPNLLENNNINNSNSKDLTKLEREEATRRERIETESSTATGLSKQLKSRMAEQLSGRTKKETGDDELVELDHGEEEEEEKDKLSEPNSKKISRFKSFLLLTAHLNPFNHHHHHQDIQQADLGQQTIKCQKISDNNQLKTPLDSYVNDKVREASDERKLSAINLHGNKDSASNNYSKNRGHFTLLEFAQRYFRRNLSNSNANRNQQNDDGHLITKSAPVTPVRWQPLDTSTATTNPTSSIKTNKLVPNGLCNQEYYSDKLTQDFKISVEKRQDEKLDNNYSSNNENKQTSSGAVQLMSQKPSVRFVDGSGGADGESDGKLFKENEHTSKHHHKIGGKSWAKSTQYSSNKTLHFSDQAVQTCDNSQQSTTTIQNNNSNYLADREINVVGKLFKLFETQPNNNQENVEQQCLEPSQKGETPMDSEHFRKYGYSLIDYISNYLDTIDKRRVTPLNIEPGYLKSLIQPDAPEKGESFVKIMHDFENHIMCGITHWQHPHFHAYFPAGNAYPSILADMLSDALGCVGFSWAASPAYTELEIIMLDWMGKMIGLPEDFLCLSGGRNSSTGEESKGGGVIQGSASECVLVNLLAARHWAIDKLRKKYPNTPDGILLSKLIGYCSKEAHSCVEKAAMIGFIRMRALDTDDKHSLRGETLYKAIQADLLNGFEPFLVCATLGTTSCVSFDNLEELGKVCQDYDIWLHVDAAYAGSALICPEFKYLIKGIELASSFNMNPNKWMLINFDCSLMWVKDRFKLTRAFVVDPLYLQHSFSDQAIDYRHWGIPLSRRFRALKLWFVIRNYGVQGLQDYIRNHVKLAKLFEKLIRQDSRFTITNQVVLGLVCFRLVGSNALNQRFLSMINASGKLHMVPASLNGRYVIRFCVCDQNAQEKDIRYAYDCISDFATELFESIKAGKERIRAISQQNTIDVSSISLHTQQSASADRLNNLPAGGINVNNNGGEQGATTQQVTTATTSTTIQSTVNQQQQQQQPVSPRDAARNYMIQRNMKHSATLHGDEHHHHNSCNLSTTPLSSRASPYTTVAANNNQRSLSANAKSPLTKQVSIQQQQQQQQQAIDGEDEDLEQEIVLDSLATIDGYDYELDDEDLLEAPFFDDVHDQTTEGVPGTNSTHSNQTNAAVGTASQTASNVKDSNANNNTNPTTLDDWRSPVARRWHSRASRSPRNQSTLAGSEHEEAEDEVLTLAERRNRMSLRYKREFFVRVVSDPRVYRASISGDINAHASCASLGGPVHQTTSVVTPTTAPTAPVPATTVATTTTTTSTTTTASQLQTPKTGGLTTAAVATATTTTSATNNNRATR